MRRTERHLDRPVKVWVPVALFFIVVSLFLCIFPFFPKESTDFPYYLPALIGIGSILCGVPVWYIKVRGEAVDLNKIDGGH